MSTAILARGLVKTFGSTRALDGLDLEVHAGEVHGFLGPNGAGKTTTIRILLGLLRATTGEVGLLGGDPWADATQLHRRLAYVPGERVLPVRPLTAAEGAGELAERRGVELAVALFGWAPRAAAPMTWTLLGLTLLIDLLGEFRLVDETVMDFSPFVRTLGPLTVGNGLAGALVALAVAAGGLVAAGFVGLARRDMSER
jgi:energy-coupling factor transporter ATP-binding protein EcfA2